MKICEVLSSRMTFLLQNIYQCTRDKVPVSRRCFGQMERRPRLQAMIHVIDDILRREYHVHADISQRQVDDGWSMLEQPFVADIGFRASSW